MTDNFTNNPAAYLSELQRIEREQELAKLRTLSLEFAGVLDFFPQLREELEAFHHSDGLYFDGLADRLRVTLKQVADSMFELGRLPNDVYDSLPMQGFIQKVKISMSLSQVPHFASQLDAAEQVALVWLKEKQKNEQQRLEREQELVKLRTLSLEFTDVLDFFPKLREELKVFHHADGIAFDGLADRLHPILKQAADLRSEIGHLSGKMLTAMEMRTFVLQAKKAMNSQSVGHFTNQFHDICQAIRQRLAQEQAERKAKEQAEAKRKENEAEAARQVREQAERKAKEQAEAKRKENEAEAARRVREQTERKAREQAEAKRKENEAEAARRVREQTESTHQEHIATGIFCVILGAIGGAIGEAKLGFVVGAGIGVSITLIALIIALITEGDVPEGIISLIAASLFVGFFAGIPSMVTGGLFDGGIGGAFGGGGTGAVILGFFVLRSWAKNL